MGNAFAMGTERPRQIEWHPASWWSILSCDRGYQTIDCPILWAEKPTLETTEALQVYANAKWFDLPQTNTPKLYEPEKYPGTVQIVFETAVGAVPLGGLLCRNVPKLVGKIK